MEKTIFNTLTPQQIVQELDKIGFDGPTTLEIAGKDAVLESAKRLQEWSR